MLLISIVVVFFENVPLGAPADERILSSELLAALYSCTVMKCFADGVDNSSVDCPSVMQNAGGGFCRCREPEIETVLLQDRVRP